MELTVFQFLITMNTFQPLSVAEILKHSKPHLSFKDVRRRRQEIVEHIADAGPSLLLDLLGKEAEKKSTKRSQDALLKAESKKRKRTDSDDGRRVRSRPDTLTVSTRRDISRFLELPDKRRVYECY